MNLALLNLGQDYVRLDISVTPAMQKKVTQFAAHLPDNVLFPVPH